MNNARPATASARKRKRVKLFDAHQSSKAGLPPGAVVHAGPVYDFKPWLSLLQYSAQQLNQKDVATLADLKAATAAAPDAVTWINLEGLHDVTLVQELGSQYDLHPLTQEDLVNAYLRPQFESFPGYYFFAIQMLYVSDENELIREHLSIILKDNIVITVQERPGDVFGAIRSRIIAATGKVRSRGADYLAYMLLDSIVDGYYRVVDRLGERVDQIEESLRNGPRDQHLGQIFELRREILFLRKNILPVREMLNKVHVDGSVFQDNTKVFLKDLSDHVMQVADSIGLSMEMSGVLIDTYHSMQNQRLNAIMKTLTMISTIFLPLNFIAGVYGMNFKHMPELEWKLGYPMALGAMVLVLIGMLWYFVRKGWLLEELDETH